MEYVQGPTIGSLLLIDGSLPLYLATEYTAQIADALDSAYSELNVIHRDIKPENLMLDRWGKIKIMDFGLARATWHQKITIAKTLVGSIYYASPEQVWGHTLDNRSDIYALGVVLYEMVSGQRPFVGRSLPELTQAITGGPVQPPSIFTPELSAELEQIILVAMARNRNERYEQAMLMAQALRALNVQAPTHFLPDTPLKTNESKTSRERVVLQPPKRPQMQRPLYLDLTHSPPGKPIASEPVPPAPPAPPVPPAPLATVSAAPPLVNAQEIDTEGPTGPLGPPFEQREIEQRSPELTKRQPFWRKLFKPSPQ